MVGAYENLTGAESQYYYRAGCLVEGYGLRRSSFIPLIVAFPEISP